jgi:hypothetical protein
MPDARVAAIGSEEHFKSNGVRKRVQAEPH